jgi:hypothetical protein
MQPRKSGHATGKIVNVIATIPSQRLTQSSIAASMTTSITAPVKGGGSVGHSGDRRRKTGSGNKG